MSFPSRIIFGLISFAVALSCASAQTAGNQCHVSTQDRSIRMTSGADVVDVEVLQANVLRVDVRPAGEGSPRTLVLDPGLKVTNSLVGTIHMLSEGAEIGTQTFRAVVRCEPQPTIAISDAGGQQLVEQIQPFTSVLEHRVRFTRNSDENLYGMNGLSMGENVRGLLRNEGAAVMAGKQGEAGAPWFFTTHYGILIDSDEGAFETKERSITFNGISRKDCEYFFIAGRPMETIAALATLTGRPPLSPKWAMGFINSQWGTTEDELKQIVATYRAKHIPLDALILDFDWKAWGEDHYGEWRWNSSSGTGNIHANEFPNGESGIFAEQMRQQGVKLAGILKPRILLYKPGSTTELDEAAAYAEAHGLWYPGEPKTADYFSGRPARDLDFSNSETRSWYWQHLRPAFQAGLIAWWNDEQDGASPIDGQAFRFDSFLGLNMGRMLYEGQRADADLRVWSINRNAYLGAQRYGYALWSGDIKTGFASMAEQRMRMLATLNLGQPHWGMDTGGFAGHPSDENYARWLEFATFVPIDRVHGDIGEKRQPWRYGATAEAAATRAIRLRYQLLPYIYSYERMAAETGIGIVRPLFWAYPDDPRLANEGSSWMFGDAFLVSPVVQQGESMHEMYLPAGTWYDYFSGQVYQGGQAIHDPVDAASWQDIPLFVRTGSIVASQPEQDYVDQKPATEITLDIFPGSATSRFVYYDDDGASYAYEKGVYYRQEIQASIADGKIQVKVAKPSGRFHPALRSYLIRVHGASVKAVECNGARLRKSADGAGDNQLQKREWSLGKDRFGAVATIRVRNDDASTLVMHE